MSEIQDNEYNMGYTLQLKTDFEEVGFEGFFSKVEGEAPVTPCRLRCFALASGGQ